MSSIETQFKVGHPLSNTGRTHFKKGCIPWNKGKIYNQIRGSKHPNWKGGTSRSYKNGYYSPEYLEWRKKVFERDNYICRQCGFKGNKGIITAHHIKSFSKFPKLRFEISNGITLCEICHSKTDNYKGRANKKS